MAIFFRQCTIDDIHTLIIFSRQRYIETFAAMNTAKNMSAYLDSAFSFEKIRAELLNVHSAFYFLHDNSSLVGYLKLNEAFELVSHRNQM